MKTALAKISGGAGLIVAIVALILLGRWISPEFATLANLNAMIQNVALLGIVAAGMAFVTYSGNLVDLSVPSIMAFAGIIAVTALPLGLPLALGLGLLAGLLIGALNGWVVGRLKANPILWTLSVAFFMEGLMRFAWSNRQVYPNINPGTPGAQFIDLFRLHIGPLPLVPLLALAIFVAGFALMHHTHFGRTSRLVGASRTAAHFAGIRVGRIVLLNFLIAAFAASVAGILLTSMNKLGVFYLGQGYDFKAVTAVVIGGIALSGGRGSLLGVFGGVLLIGLLGNVMTFMGITAFRQNIVTGLVFILVVGIQQFRLRAQGGSDAPRA